jgi:hypothetical protein
LNQDLSSGVRRSVKQDSEVPSEGGAQCNGVSKQVLFSAEEALFLPERFSSSRAARCIASNTVDHELFVIAEKLRSMGEEHMK